MADRETVETMADLFWGAPKSLQMVTTVMKLKDACFLEEKKVKALSHVRLCDPMDCSLPRFSTHGIFPGKSTGVDRSERQTKRRYTEVQVVCLTVDPTFSEQCITT